MATFRVGQSIATREPSITVDAGLEPGRYRFRLVVEDDSGNRSEPDEATVVVVEPLREPTLTTDTLRSAILSPLRTFDIPFPGR